MITKTGKGQAQRFYREVVLTCERGPEDECLIWPFARDNGGRGTINGRERVHRLVCEEENGPPPTPEHEAAHNCGKGHLACVTRGHLSWKTHAENMADRITHGTSNRGELNPWVKLTEGQARDIRWLKGVALQRDIAAAYGVSITSVSLIQSGKNWGWLEEPT